MTKLLTIEFQSYSFFDIPILCLLVFQRQSLSSILISSTLGV